MKIQLTETPRRMTVVSFGGNDPLPNIYATFENVQTLYGRFSGKFPKSRPRCYIGDHECAPGEVVDFLDATALIPTYWDHTISIELFPSDDVLHRRILMHLQRPLSASRRDMFHL